MGVALRPQAGRHDAGAERHYPRNFRQIADPPQRSGRAASWAGRERPIRKPTGCTWKGGSFGTGAPPQALKKSIDLFQQAIAADPSYALAYTGLADTYNVAPSYGIGISSQQGRALADEASRKALELDSSLPEAHAARAGELAMSWRWSEAEPEFRRALELSPNNANAHYFYALQLFLLPQKRFDQALDEFRIALSLDPLSPIVNTNYAATLMMAHRFSEAVAQFQKTLERDPSFGPAHFYLAHVYAMQGRFADAVNEIKKIGTDPGSYSPDAQGFTKEMLSPTHGPLPANVALAYAVAGDPEKAFEYLERAYSEEDSELLAVIRFPGFDSLHSDPRWADLLKKMGLPL